jgi:predicted negative regulator of RcsB-dependent stress response
MATYNKRGYKPKTKPEKEDNDQLFDDSESTTAEVFSTLDEGANKTEQWLEKNQKALIIVVALIALGAATAWAYNQFVTQPLEMVAVEESSEANKYYDLAVNSTGKEKDSLFGVALEGANGKYGLIKLSEEYKGTAVGNLATYQAGMAYLNIGGDQLQKAIDYLKAYEGGDSVLNSIAKAGIGDALVQAGQAGDAVAYYMDAANANVNDYSTPKYLLKAAQVALSTGDNSTAVTALERIEENYPDTDEINTVQVLLGQAKAASN